MDTAEIQPTCDRQGMSSCRATDHSDKMPRLLYVDHNPASLVRLTVLLAMSRYVVFSTQNPLQALDLVRSIPLNLALLDYDLRSMSGAELARQIRRLKPTLPIAMFAGTRFVPREVLVVADRYLQKDADVQHLLQQLNSWTTTLHQVA
jgi:two-component system sensor histidine kinase BarA